jgi:hypothetical protein
MAIQIIIMVVWTTTDPFKSVLDLRADFEGNYGCTSSHNATWLALEATYFGVLLVTSFTLWEF